MRLRSRRRSHPWSLADDPLGPSFGWWADMGQALCERRPRCPISGNGGGSRLASLAPPRQLRYPVQYVSLSSLPCGCSPAESDCVAIGYPFCVGHALSGTNS